MKEINFEGYLSVLDYSHAFHDQDMQDLTCFEDGFTIEALFATANDGYIVYILAGDLETVGVPQSQGNPYGPDVDVSMVVCFYGSEPFDLAIRLIEQYDLSMLSDQDFFTVLSSWMKMSMESSLLNVGVDGNAKIMDEVRRRGFFHE